jgi:exopolysaccharide biosynthesis polyprenyl glycosylphosphotransferase
MAERSDDVRTATVVYLRAPEGRTEGSARPRHSVLQRYRSLSRWMAVTDGLALVAAALLVPAGWGQDTGLPRIAGPLAYAALQLVIYCCFHLYAPHRTPASEEFRRLILATTVGVAAAVVVAVWSESVVTRTWMLGAWSLALVLVGAARLAWRARIADAQRHGELSLRTLVVGTNDEAKRLIHAMRSRPVEGFEPIGALAVDRQVVEVDGLPVFGTLSEVVDVAARTGADCVFVASSAVRVEDVSWLTRVLRPEDVEVRFSTSLPDLLISRISLQPIARIPSLSVRRVRLTGAQSVVKRCVDVAGALFLLAVTAPLWAVIALAVRCTSAGPILFRQERIGMRGAPFTMFKFRTMVWDAQDRLAEVRHLNEASGPLFKIKSDPRVTRVGRFLRRHSLDELPQLLNVLRGDMSLVGPRPPLRSEVSAYERWHFARLEVRPGMTGLGQVTGRSDRSFEDTVRLDVFYIENWSLAYDLFIAAKTIPALIHGRGAY